MQFMKEIRKKEKPETILIYSKYCHIKNLMKGKFNR